jgi:hypothetical protein
MSTKTTTAQKAASERYDRTHTTRIFIKLNNATDADILARLETVGNKQGYIKTLIRADIEHAGRDL